MLRKHTQHRTPQSTRTSSKASTRWSERDSATKQTELARANHDDVSSSIHAARCVFLKRTTKSACLYNLLFFLPVLSIFRSCTRRPRVLFVDHGELLRLKVATWRLFASRHFAPKTIDHSVRFVHSHLKFWFKASLWASVAGGGGAKKRLVVHTAGVWIKHITPNSFRVQCPRRFWETDRIDPEKMHSVHVFYVPLSSVSSPLRRGFRQTFGFLICRWIFGS